ncbi:TIGR03564 family F420-dependent LLM class oxidoreductase [Pseudonocardia spinosispora]|uniref:TIGR03564 family F420-dependent LLM class oxidoreductase n=1 Tax=Pseudonocardia spinosispora TaxID=103441 RepID=UPI0003FEDBDD|nr:TIGR03564 family F420-dependent LLM class oxidoreductase [Pseudonocardia spinosispora]
MRIGIYLDTANGGLDELIGRIRDAADAGLHSAYLSQIFSWDALTVAALAGQAVPDIELGTAVVQTYPRHPLALAGQALTAQAASGNRLTLGIGPSHAPIIEGVFGYSFERPVRHVREYLTALRPLLRGETVEYRGATLSVAGQVPITGVEAPEVLISALGPMMLRLAGELADGTVTVWATPETIGERIVPALTEAAVGRPAPRVVAAVLASVTHDPDGARERMAQRFGVANELPSYRLLLAQQGMTGVHETMVAGDESTLADAVDRFARAGVTELLVSAHGTEEERARTLDTLAAIRLSREPVGAAAPPRY